MALLLCCFFCVLIRFFAQTTNSYDYIWCDLKIPSHWMLKYEEKKTSLLNARTPICSRRENCKRFCDPMESNNACKSKEDIHKK